jgi:hypothetical protein
MEDVQMRKAVADVLIKKFVPIELMLGFWRPPHLWKAEAAVSAAPAESGNRAPISERLSFSYSFSGRQAF